MASHRNGGTGWFPSWLWHGAPFAVISLGDLGDLWRSTLIIRFILMDDHSWSEVSLASAYEAAVLLRTYGHITKKSLHLLRDRLAATFGERT